jgi:hypothetical protein
MSLKRNIDKSKNYTTLFIKDIPVDVKAHFKAYCARRGKSMTQMLIKMMCDKIGATYDPQE